MIELLDELGPDAAARGRVLDAAARQLEWVAASRGRGPVELVAHVERAVARDPMHAFRFASDGTATLTVEGQRFCAGHFEVASLGTLRARALTARERNGSPAAQLRLWVLDGSSPVTDIGGLQASAAPGTLFQVASQFNCLESPGAFVTPVSRYVNDPTQGPRAAASAFPAALLRHYAAPAADGTRFVQRNDGEQVELLAAVCAPGVAKVENGYLREFDIEDPSRFVQALTEKFEHLAVGVHSGVEVVLGADWAGGVPRAPHQRVSQVLTSTVAGGMYGGAAENPEGERICQQLLRAAYLGTLSAAAGLGMRRVVLTLIGGGVFQNPVPLIWQSLCWAADQLPPLLHDDLTIVVNGRELSGSVPMAELMREAGARGGGVLVLERGGAARFAD